MESSSGPLNSAENSEESVDWKSDENQIFLNPRLNDVLQSHYRKIFREACYRHGIKGHLGFLTSGTTVIDPRGYKLVFISKAAFLNSAQAVNKTLLIGAKDIWLQCLPRFHVGGMAIEARAHVGGFQVVRYTGAWNAHKFHLLAESSGASFTSMVPTQVYDVVKNKLPSPRKLRVLVGGGRLSPIVAKQAQDLKWQLLLSYGLTELGSTVAMIEMDALRPLPHVSLDIVDGRLAIRSTSLFTAYAQVIKGQIELTKPNLKNGYFITEDSVTKMNQKILLLGRSQDVVKVSGELVSLPRVRDEWFAFCDLAYAHNFHILSVADARTENKIVMVVQKDEKMRDHKVVTGYSPLPTLRQQFQEFQEKVMPFERVQNVYVIDKIPRTDLGKVQDKIISDMIEKAQLHEIKLA
ncbi:MAG: AMP-binding protein [Bdellovibrionales bacterium]